jgi:hypothetical protein
LKHGLKAAQEMGVLHFRDAGAKRRLVLNKFSGEKEGEAQGQEKGRRRKGVACGLRARPVSLS